jgi:hypothetical protein
MVTVLWHIDPLLGNDREANNATTTAIARQQLLKYAAVLKPLLGSNPPSKMEVRLEPAISTDPLRDHITRPSE